MANVYVIEEGTTNIYRYPTWQSIPSTTSSQIISVDSDEKYEGRESIRVEVSEINGNSALVFLASGPVSSGDIYTVSFKAKRGAGNPVFTPYLYMMAGQGLTGGVNVQTFNSDDWSLHTMTFSPLTKDSTHIDFRLYHAGAMTAGSVVYIADMQIEKKAYATSFTHGGMGEGYSWEGEPHNSPSIREPSSISMPSPEPESLYIRYSENGEIWNNQYVSFEDKPEDIEPTLLLSPDGSYDREGEVTPTLTGGVLEVNGQYGKAWQVAEETTNLVPNPAFAHTTPLLGWSSQHVTTEVLPPDAEAIAAGCTANMLKITKSSTISSIVWTDVIGAYTIPVTAGQIYTGSMRVKGVAGKQMSLVLYYRDDVGYLAADGRFSTLVDDGNVWQRYSVTAVAPANATRVTLMLYVGGSEGANLDVDDVAYMSTPQVEQKPYATAYADGSLGAGHTWTGTPHQSSSNREGGMVWTTAKDYIDQHRGTVLMRLMREGEGQYNDYMFMLGDYGDSDSIYLYQSANDSPTAIISRTGGGGTVLSSRPMVIGKWESIGTSWDGPEMNLSFGTGEKFSRSRPVPSGTLLDRISTSYNSLQPMNGRIESILVFDTALTDAEIERIVTMDEAWTWEETTGFKVTSDLGQHAKIRYVDNNLKLLTDKKLYIGTVIGFSRPLSQKEIEILDSTPLEYISGKTLLNLPETTVGVSQLL